MALTLNDIETLFQQRGHEQYSGEPVTQLQHALQSAYLGEQEGASDELVTAAFLHDLVIDAVQRHVDAKRYLCATRPEYYGALSEDSKRSLKLQGGIFSAEEAAQFIAEPGAPDALRLRLWDDLAKQPETQTPELSHYMPIARRCALRA